ncbi:hypothetical protein BDW_12325 [Bdellovibrio bacteriovorus W]|nr:hypothetical protein BDW_12325 [Bdellovibrio bacteriovorus W]
MDIVIADNYRYLRAEFHGEDLWTKAPYDIRCNFIHIKPLKRWSKME